VPSQRAIVLAISLPTSYPKIAVCPAWAFTAARTFCRRFGYVWTVHGELDVLFRQVSVTRTRILPAAAHGIKEPRGGE